MRKVTAILCILIFIAIAHGQERIPNRIDEKNVPKAVLKKFNSKRPEATDIKWYPYPNQFGKDRGAVPTHFPIGWKGYSQDYYEVRFSDAKGPLREVYDRGGNWKVTSRALDKLPDELASQLSERGYDEWKKERIERISRVGQTGQFYKVWLTLDKRKRILFFDNTFKLVKTLRWDNDLKLMVNANAKPKAATVKKTRRVIGADGVPEEIRAKARKNHVNVEIVEWAVYQVSFDPFEGPSQFSYYDFVAPAYYQLIFSDKSERFIASYSIDGDLLEIADLLPTRKLPKAIRKSISSDLYESWKWENEHERVETDDGNLYYRVYGSESDTPRVLILNADGTIIKLERP